MGKALYTTRQVNLGANTSSQTGTPWYVGDAATLSVSISSSASNGSRFTIVGSNDDGFQSALGTPSQTGSAGNWSVVTAIVQQGIYTIDPPAFRWINAFRDGTSVASMTTIVFAQKVN